MVSFIIGILLFANTSYASFLEVQRTRQYSEIIRKNNITITIDNEEELNIKEYYISGSIVSGK